MDLLDCLEFYSDFVSETKLEMRLNKAINYWWGEIA